MTLILCIITAFECGDNTKARRRANLKGRLSHSAARAQSRRVVTIAERERSSRLIH